MPQITATTTQRNLSAGAWKILTLQNLSATEPAFVARKSGVTKSGATGGLRIAPNTLVVLSGGAPDRGGPWVITATGTAVLAWDVLSVVQTTPGRAGVDGALGADGAAGTDGVGILGAFTTATRPDAVTSGAGASYFDTTASRPGWSDGTKWIDAAGTEIVAA